MSWRERVFGPSGARTAVVLAFVLSLPFCASGLFLDDYMHRYLLEGLTPALGDRWHLFTFAGGGPERMMPYVANGPFPWWTSLNLHFAFFRPLTALVANLEHAAWGANAPLMHLHSIAWYVALVAVAARVFRRAFGVVAVASLAAVLFALDDVHGLVAGWVANRNATIASVPALLAVLAHVRWREDGWRWGLPLSVLAAALGLAGGEVALGALAYLGAWELTRGPGGWARRLTSLVPMGVLGAGYVALYKWTGSGARGSGIYADPLNETGKYLTQLPAKALTLFGAQFLGSTADLWLAVEALRPALVTAGVLAIGVVAALLRALWRELDDTQRRGVRWLGLGGVLSLLPVLATFPLNRLLLMPSLGGAAVTAVLLLAGWRSATRWVRWSTRLLFVTTVIGGVLGWVGTFAGATVGAWVMRHGPLETTVADEALAGRVFAFSAPDPSALMYPAVVRRFAGKPPAQAWLTLTFAPFPVKLTRVSERVIDVEVVGGRMLGTLFEQLFRSDEEPLVTGSEVRLTGALLEVTEADAGRVGRLRVTFDAPPESGFFTFVRWDGDVLSALTLPAVGESVTLPKPSGLLSL